MPEPKRPLKVFLCHASADKPAVRNLYKRLVADGVDVWLDAESLVAGQNWQVEIPKAIRESDVVIVCLSEKSINKEGYVQREIKFALDVADEKPEGTIFIVPAKLEECKVPDRLGMYHWVELVKKDGYERLLRALHLRADKIGATLQIKKSWFPDISSSSKQPAKIKKSIAEEKEPDSKPRKFSRITYWFGGFIVLVLGIFFLSSLNNPSSTLQPTPETTQTKNISTSIPIKTLTPEVSRTKTKIFSPTFTPSITLTTTPIITLTSEPTVNPVAAILSANTRNGTPPLVVSFSANLKLSDGTLVCTNSSECTYFWSVQGRNFTFFGLKASGRNLSYSFTSAGTYYMAVTVCYRTMCDSDVVTINVY
jgi:hypothetical protein